MPKLKSISEIFSGSKDAARHYPGALVCAAIVTGISIYLIEIDSFEKHLVLSKLIIVGSIGLPMFIAISALSITRKVNRSFQLGFNLIGLIWLVVYFFSLPENPGEPLLYIVRSSLILLAFHFLVAWLPYINTKQVDQFWQYNVSLFIRFLTAGVYSAVLFVGIAIAIAAIDHLFGVQIDEKIYMQIWVLVAGLFNTWFFLGGICSDSPAFGPPGEYPKLLRVFGQYILMPLVMLYFVILIAYEAKIIIEWNWPRGWVSQLVLWFSVLGIFSLLVLYPLREKEEHRWIKRYFDWFFIGLSPLLVMLYLAIYRRLSDYGITENRYFVLAMAIGLTILTLAFLFGRTRNIKLIPAVLFGIGFLSAVGPWSASSLSRISQTGRLLDYIAEEKQADGRYDFSDKKLADAPRETRAEIGSIVMYLAEYHGLKAFEGILDDSTMTELDTLKYYEMAREITEHFGFEYIALYPGMFGEEIQYFNIKMENGISYDIGGFERMVVFYLGPFDADSLSKYDTACDCRIVIDREAREVEIMFGPDAPHGADTTTCSITDIIEGGLEQRFNNSTDKGHLTIDDMSRENRYRLAVREMHGWVKDDSTTITGAELWLFVP